jgi:hypothetical protein
MSSITIAVDDEVLERAQLRAAALHTSVPALVQQYLADIAKSTETDGERFQRLLALERETRACVARFSAADRLPRAELYDRKL